MDNEINMAGFGQDEGARHRAVNRSRVLLREPERCAQCNKVFLGLYTIRTCNDHEGLDEI